MHRFMAGVAVLVLLATQGALAAPKEDVASVDTVLRWINAYRHKPDVTKVPVAFRALARQGALVEPEKSAVYVGFLAGIIAANPNTAEDIVGKILPLPDDSQWVIVRAIAYSGIRAGRRC